MTNKTSAEPDAIRYALMGSCLIHITACYFRYFETHYRCLASVRFNQIQRIVRTYLTNEWQVVPWSYLRDSQLQIDFQRFDGTSHCILCYIESQYDDRLLGKAQFRHHVPEASPAMPFSVRLREAVDFDVLVVDTFFDLVARWSRPIPEAIEADPSLENSYIFLQAQEILNHHERFTLEPFPSLDSVVEAYRILVQYLLAKKPDLKIIVMNFPLLHHHSQAMRNRVRKLNARLAEIEGIFFVPAQVIPFIYLKNPNHFQEPKTNLDDPKLGRNLYCDYAAAIAAIAEGKFTWQDWRDYVAEANGELLDRVHAELKLPVVPEKKK